ncbi:hypothetical protein CLV25_108107 [Acetobacteroides hydrogenigenes]|uniref:Uncharacterized protein n=1 Tax=Acetobacteroides hydrogenigenes TaxID=979970 RepID=A0A4R2ED48_9BACT|nr:hypothetical protein CLV25_108107 [Acetobacteroides hydrogenigenes]
MYAYFIRGFSYAYTPAVRPAKRARSAKEVLQKAFSSSIGRGRAAELAGSFSSMELIQILVRRPLLLKTIPF